MGLDAKALEQLAKLSTNSDTPPSSDTSADDVDERITQIVEQEKAGDFTDSLPLWSAITLIEDEYKISLPDDRVRQCATVNDLIDLVNDVR